MLDAGHPDAVALAVAELGGGNLAILPTDTVYGITADIRQDAAVRALYAAKGKGAEAPLQLLFGEDTDMLASYADAETTGGRRFIESIGPGGWTLIVPAAPGWDSPALAGGRTVGVRIPAVPFVHEVVAALGAPLAASSANQHGGPSPILCASAVAQVGAACAVAIDGGPTQQGLDSTVIDLSAPEPRILREGAIDRATVARILGVAHIPVLRSIRP